MKKVTVYWSEITEAFELSTTGADYYLDTESGRTLLVMEDSQDHLNKVYREYYDPDNPDSFDIEAALAKSDLQDWEKTMVAEAHIVEQHFGSRVILIPDLSSHESYVEMENFIRTMKNGRLQDRLWNAIQKRKPFSQFRHVIQQNPDDLQRWYDYKDEQMKKRTLAWLEDIENVEIELDYGTVPLKNTD